MAVAAPTLGDDNVAMEYLAPNYCPRCGTAIAAPAGDDRPTCADCGYVAYADPKVATGVLVSRPLDSAGEAPSNSKNQNQPNDLELLLVRRNHEPALGRWAFPSGYVDAGEVVEAAAIREVFEETGVTVALDQLIGVYSEAGNIVVFVAYAGHLVSGEAAAGDEAFEVGWFSPDALPALAFPHDDQIVADWRLSFGRTQ
jgi:ADP-ribose pyrophosphatase YjhB (NUDIX family)/ribosomal protein S27AE